MSLLFHAIERINTPHQPGRPSPADLYARMAPPAKSRKRLTLNKRNIALATLAASICLISGLSLAGMRLDIPQPEQPVQASAPAAETEVKPARAIDMTETPVTATKALPETDDTNRQETAFITTAEPAAEPPASFMHVSLQPEPLPLPLASRHTDETAPQDWSAELRQAQNHMQQQRINAAIHIWSEIIDQAPRHKEARIARAEAYFETGQLAAAETDYMAILTDAPEVMDALIALNDARSHEQPQASLNALTALQALRPHRADIPALIARIHSHAGRDQNAIPFWQAAIANAPHDPRHILNLALGLDRLGRHMEALDAYRTALAVMENAPQSLPLTATQIEARIGWLEGQG